MAKYFIQDETLTNLADKIRILNGTEDTMTPDEMNSELASANDEVDAQSTLIDQLSEMLDGKASGGGSEATPEISVSSNGLITATAGTKSATKQLNTQVAQTITPSASDKIIASGRYLTGAQTIKGDANLIAENIKNGISIFGISGSYSGGSGDYVVGTATLDDEGNLIIPELIGKSRFIVVRESTTMLPVITGGHLGIVDTLYCLDGSLITAKMYKSGAAELLDSVIIYDNTTGAFSYDHSFATITFEDTNYIYIAW